VHVNDLGVHTKLIYIYLGVGLCVVVYALKLESLCDYEAGESRHK
jgi:hypothetical protein